MKIFACASLALAALLAPSAHAHCLQPILSVGVFHSDQYTYASHQQTASMISMDQKRYLLWEDRWGRKEHWPSPLGKVRVGVSCGPLSLIGEHVSSLRSGRDRGIDQIGLELDLVRLFRGH